MARDFKGTVKEILGTAVSVGCTVDNSDPKDILKKKLKLESLIKLWKDKSKF